MQYIHLALMLHVSVRLSVRLSVTEVHWRIIANLGFKFRSKFTTHCGTSPQCDAVHAGALWSRCMPGRGEGSSRAMLAIARPSCYCFTQSLSVAVGVRFHQQGRTAASRIQD